MELHELFDTKVLDDYIKNGYISRRVHPHLPLISLNYTEKARRMQLWDDVIRTCRGLVVDIYGYIIVNCMPRIYDFDALPPNFDMSGPTQVTELLPGNLVYIAFYQGEPIIVTRDGFETNIIEAVYDLLTEEEWKALKILCNSSVTAVINMTKSQIMLLGVITDYKYKNSKQIWTPADQIYSWPGVAIRRLKLTFREALNHQQDVIVYFENTGDRLKVRKEIK